MSSYRRTARWFLEYLQRRFPEVTRSSKLQRDPHVLGWLEELWRYRTASGEALQSSTRCSHVLQLRTLLETMEDLADPPRPGLLLPSDVPKRHYPLPRPLTVEDDQLLRSGWDMATRVEDCALYLMRLTGIRIGECVDLAPDCMRHLGGQQWSLHVPLGKPRSERWVPIEDKARELVERLLFLRTVLRGTEPQFLIPRPAGRSALMSSLRHRLREAAAEVGITAAIVPHQLRHTYATSLLRAGIGLPALMRLLGHHNANITLIYVEITQEDLHNEYRSALAHPRYLVPRQLTADSAPQSIEDALMAAIPLLDGEIRKAAVPTSLLLIRRRVVRIITFLKKWRRG
jgi:site-specific recombinase XerD